MSPSASALVGIAGMAPRRVTDTAAQAFANARHSRISAVFASALWSVAVVTLRRYQFIQKRAYERVTGAGRIHHRHREPRQAQVECRCDEPGAVGTVGNEQRAGTPVQYETGRSGGGPAEQCEFVLGHFDDVAGRQGRERCVDKGCWR